jgi:hypothetical protein
MSAQAVAVACAVVHAHRWGHGRPALRPPDVLLSEAERLGLLRPLRWPTVLFCLDWGELWPGQPFESVYAGGRS